MLENENKILKNEINDSRNKLSLLESKIDELLKQKQKNNSLEKEECPHPPQPTPYVKKYSLEAFNNIQFSPILISNNDETLQKEKFKETQNKKEENKNDNFNCINFNKVKNKVFLNQLQKTPQQSKIKYYNYNNNNQKPKLIHLNTNNSTLKLKDKKKMGIPSKINVNKKSNV